MKIVYLIGNGLDVKLKLKTRYEEFYKNAYAIDRNDPDYIKSFKEAIKNNINDWADLEKKLGEYSVDVDTEDLYLSLFKDIRMKLLKYISEQEIKVSLSDEERDVFISQFRDPNNYLVVGENNELNQFIKNLNTSEQVVDFITFNYTKTLETILNFNDSPIYVQKQGRRDLRITQIEHVHGFTDLRFVLGVDNIGQILNEKFRSNNLSRTIIKPINNFQAKHLVDNRCKALIDKANIICLYGMSIGETDRTWWEYIGSNLYNYDKRLIIFWWDNEEDFSPIFSEIRLEKVDVVKEKFLSQTNLNEKQKQAVVDRIYVIYKKEQIFSLPKNLIDTKKS